MELKKIIRSAKASIETEGYNVTKDIEELVIKEANGEISFNDFSKHMQEIAKQP
ncbi:hypothetical protein [Bacillus sp. 1P06AnD]|uniref:antitoxin VbhA family protein n=1 Tax=Bacillus sp. 1P06AnD TaxID=3132208 RepID=UPI0039A086AF